VRSAAYLDLVLARDPAANPTATVNQIKGVAMDATPVGAFCRAVELLAAVEMAVAAYSAEIASLRRDGLTCSLDEDSAERFFALGSALEQMHNNCKDLERRAVEWTGPPKETQEYPVRLIVAQGSSAPPFVPKSRRSANRST